MKSESREIRESPMQNVLAGLTVAVVALPLALAFGRTAFGDTYGPAAGLWGAILGGFVAALLGGSAYAITGPTGVLAIFTADLVATHGGFSNADAIAFGFLAVVLSGVIQILFGLTRMGRVIEFIPYPVITGFMSGVALLIIWTGVKDAINPGGNPLTDRQGFAELGHVFVGTSPTFVYLAVGLAALALALTFGWPRLVRKASDRGAMRVLKQIPGSLIALLVVTILAATLPGVLPSLTGVHHIAALPKGGPIPFQGYNVIARHPEWTRDLLLGALGLALISSIDTLLTCVIADSVVGQNTKSNRELVAQGVANTVAGAFSATQNCGAAVRTMVNVKNGGRSRLAGMSHALFLLLALLVGGSLVTLVPIPALSGILIVTGIGMVEWHAIFTAYKAPKSDTFVMLVTVVLTVTVGLVEAVLVGVVLAALLFIKRMTELTNFVTEDQDNARAKWSGFGGDVAVYYVRGPLFFGAASKFSQTIDRGKLGGKIVVFKMHAVTATDETGMRTFSLMVDRFHKLKMRVMVVGLPPEPYQKFFRFGLVERVGRENFFGSTSDALAAAHLHIHGTPAKAHAFDAADVVRS